MTIEEELDHRLDTDNVDLLEQQWNMFKNLETEEYPNILFRAAEYQAVECFKFIVEKGIVKDINVQAKDQTTVLTTVFMEYNDQAEEMAEILFKTYPDIDPDIPNAQGRNAVLEGMMSGISSKYIMLAAEKTKNLEQQDTSMNETVVDACIRNDGMYRTYALVLELYINRGANITKHQLYKIMVLIGDNEHSIVKKALENREDQKDDILLLASEGGFVNFLPEEVKDLFLF